jgi:hypothetical protein
MATHRKFSTALNFTLLIGADQGTRQKFNARYKGPVKTTRLWVYTRKYSTIVSGPTTVGSADRAPDDIIKQKQAATRKMKEGKFTSAYTQNIFWL